MQEGFFFTHLL